VVMEAPLLRCCASHAAAPPPELLANECFIAPRSVARPGPSCSTDKKAGCHSNEHQLQERSDGRSGTARSVPALPRGGGPPLHAAACNLKSQSDRPQQLADLQGLLTPVGAHLSMIALCSSGGTLEQPLRKKGDDDDDLDFRQHRQAASGKIVSYEWNDYPNEDVFLRGGSGRPVRVASVCYGGKAMKAGVKAGDVLVSINGTRDFGGASALQVHDNLKGPAVIVFLGLAGKLKGEVCIRRKEQVLGLSSRTKLLPGSPEEPVEVVDEVVFEPAQVACEDEPLRKAVWKLG